MSEAPEVAAPVVPEGPPDVPKSKEDVSQQSEEPSEEIGESEATGEPDSQDVDAVRLACSAPSLNLAIRAH